MKIENDRQKSLKNLMGYRPDGFYEIALVKTFHFFMSNSGNLIHRVREARVHMRYDAYSHTSVSLYCGNNGFPGQKGRLIEAPAPNEYELCPYCEIKAVAIGLPTTQDLLGYELKLATIQPRKRFPASEPKQNSVNSMSKTAIIMSEAEAMALPQSKRPLSFRVTSKIYHDVFEAIGTASMCWRPRPGNNVFNSEEASNVAVNLCSKIAEELERLGVTTEMMRDQFPDSQTPQPQNKTMMDITPEESARMAAVTGTPTAQREMPRYQCHKKVWALKIADVKEVGRRAPNGELVEIVKELSFEDSGFVPIRVDARWYDKHRPTPGGYYVRYEDGYESYSPAKAFEDGYTRIP